jgi:LacI family transcriptional regulator
MATIYDVAKKAGVSASTVSRVFNKSARISTATQEKVRLAAAELNYQPNVQASALTTKRTLLVGLVIPDIQNPFSATLARGVQDYVTEQGYLSIICSTDGDPEKEIKLMREIHRRGVDGFIITPPHTRQSQQENEFIEQLLKKGMPIVFIGNRLDNPTVDFVTSRAQDGAMKAVLHLAQLGHQRIGFIGGHYTQGVAVGRWLGYQEAIITSNLTIRPEYMLESDLSQDGGETAMGQLLALPNRPTAVLCVNDLMAVGAMRACQQHGIDVPTDMSIIGFDDIPLARLTRPPLTTVAQPAYDLGCKSAELLLNRTQNSKLLPQQVTLQSELIIRDSTAPPPD